MRKDFPLHGVVQLTTPSKTAGVRCEQPNVTRICGKNEFASTEPSNKTLWSILRRPPTMDFAVDIMVEIRRRANRVPIRD